MKTPFVLFLVLAAGCSQQPPAKPVGPEQPAPDGAALYAQLGCKVCHTLDGTTIPGAGPSFRGLFGSTVTLDDGSSVIADEVYLAESMRDPDAKTVAGFPKNVMPRFDRMLSEAQVAALIDFIRAQQ